MPVAPEFIPQAMGLVRFDPADQPQGPFPVGAGRLQIRSVYHGALGDLRKITVVDSQRGVVLEQHLYDTRNTRVASSFTSNFHRDPVTGAVLPKHVEIQYPSTQFDLKIDMVDIQVNVLGPQNAQLWVKPEYPGYPNVNLADPGLPVASMGNVSAMPMPAAQAPGMMIAPVNGSPVNTNPANMGPVVTAPGTPVATNSTGQPAEQRIAAQPTWGAAPGSYPAGTNPAGTYPPGNYAPATAPPPGYAPASNYAPRTAPQAYSPYP
jgi:hypothetical protein